MITTNTLSRTDLTVAEKFDRLPAFSRDAMKLAGSHAAEFLAWGQAVDAGERTWYARSIEPALNPGGLVVRIWLGDGQVITEPVDDGPDDAMDVLVGRHHDLLAAYGGVLVLFDGDDGQPLALIELAELAWPGMPR